MKKLLILLTLASVLVGCSSANCESQQPKEQLGTCAFRVIGTYNQIKNLRKFMVDNGIKFETIKTEGN